MMKKSKAGFTLAEVLTTLMVIGVVAAMTVPTLMNSTDDSQKKAAFKKAMSVLGQAAQLSVAKELEHTVSDSESLTTFMTDVISGTVVENTNASNKENIIQTADGMAFQFIYRGTPLGYSANLREICGTAKDVFENTKDSWAAKDASCLVVIDVNGMGKGTKSFTDITGSGALTSANMVKGSDQIPLVLTGDGVRPVYIEGLASGHIMNRGYEYIYGDGSSPST